MSVSVLRKEDSGIGEAVKVEPITEMKDIRSIKKMLRSNSRDYLLFIMGINSGLRVQDILKLKIRDIKNHPINSRLIVEEKILLPRELDGYVIDSDTLNKIGRAHV